VPGTYLDSAGWQLLEQRLRTGSSLGSVAEEQFVWSVSYIDGLILRDRNADLNNATGAGGLEERVYALQDALWNTTALVDENGNVLNRFAYTPYGVVETLNPNWTHAASPSIPWAVLFRGYFADEGTGLFHARARQYSPTLGRFVGRDPAGYVDGLLLYGAYFVPNGLDPVGMYAICCGECRTVLEPQFDPKSGFTGQLLKAVPVLWNPCRGTVEGGIACACKLVPSGNGSKDWYGWKAICGRSAGPFQTWLDRRFFPLVPDLKDVH
jgi:RHS repeat-associated protein